MGSSAGFSFGGKTLYRPGILVTSEFGSQRVLQLLPNGLLCFVGSADGGLGGGAVYQFSDLSVAETLLRSGPLLDAAKNAGALGGASGFVLVAVGTKTSASLNYNGAAGATGTFNAGDAGAWTNGIAITLVTGSSSGFALTVTWPNPDGSVNTYGGKGTNLDNINTLSQLAAAIAADPVLTPSASTGYPAILKFTVTQDGNLVALTTTNLAGGSGTGGTVNTVVAASPAPTTTVFGVQDATNISAGTVLHIGTKTGTVLSVSGTTVTLTAALASAPTAGDAVSNLNFSDFQPGIDALADVPFDIGHLVSCYDEVTQAYFDGLCQQVAPYGLFHRLIHQAKVTGASPNNSKAVNSEALTSSGVSVANSLNSVRSSVCVQKLLVRDATTGQTTWIDGAIVACGDAALQAATGAWGPATPLTYDAPATVLDLDYAVLDKTGDVTTCEKNGVMLFERFGTPGQAGSVRIVHSLTTAPNDSNGNAWPFREFSVVRVSDALLANVKAQVEDSSPKALGGGNTVKTMGAVISDVVDVLELAIDNQWINGFDPASIVITNVGNLGTDDVVRYSASPTLPLNHLGIAQTLLPFQVAVSTSGVING